MSLYCLHLKDGRTAGQKVMEKDQGVYFRKRKLTLINGGDLPDPVNNEDN